MDLETGVTIPRITTIQRNNITSPKTGRLVFNIDVAQYQYWNGSAWQPMSGGSAVSNYKTTADGSSTTYTFAGATFASTPSTLVFVNGLAQVPTTNYTASGTNVVFASAPAASAVIDVFALGQPVIVPSLSGSTGNSVTWGGSFPSTGTYLRGDVVFSTMPAASGFVGWSCVVGGSPGTWKTFGPISA